MTLDEEQVARALPGYDIGDEIGRGGWGVVLRAEHRQLGRPVAIKQLPRAFAADPGVRRRFVSEARLLATLDHPHIVPIYDYVEEEGLCLLVMELLPGGTLWNRFTTEGVSADSACGIVVAACSALQHAHAKGILHRDIKPDNMLFAASGTVKVSDFGIAKVVGGTASMATRTGEVLGTPAYMAPEQALGAELTPATDVYALGTVLYELLSGRLPFVDDGNAIALLYRHVHEAPTPLAEAAPDLPPELVETTMRALAADPEERYESAEDFGVALADAAMSALGPDWVQRGGVAVMATGRIGARISGPAHFADTEPRPLTPPIVSTAEPAGATVLESAPLVEPATAKPAPGTEITSISPDELVPIQDVTHDAPDAPASAPPPAAPPPVPAPHPVPAPPATGSPDRKRRNPVVIGLVVLVLAALVAGGVVLFGGGGSKDETTPQSTTPQSTSSQQKPAGTVAATIPVLGRADHLAFASEAMYVTESTSKQLARIDPSNNRVTQITSLPHRPHAIGALGGVLWVSSSDASTIMRVEPGADASRTKVTDIPVGAIVADLTTGAGAVWATDPEAATLLRIDPATNAVTARIPIGSTPDAVVVDANGVWVANRQSSGAITRVDPATNRVVGTIPVGAEPDQVDAGAGGVWTANRADGTVTRIDPATNKAVATITVGGKPRSVLVGEGAVWVSISSGNTVARIDPATNQVTGTVTVGQSPEHGAVGAGSIWIANTGDDTVSRIKPSA